MEKNVCIVNFNTTELTTAAIQSLWKHTPDCKVTVFDNSDRIPFPGMNGVRVIDNTKGQIIDFVEFLNRFPNKTPTKNDWGSAKHIYTIHKLFDYFPDGFVLMDSDVLVKKDISYFFDEQYGYAGTIFCDPMRRDRKHPRLLPFICWINVKMCMENGISYYDPDRNWKLCKGIDKWYDTGASFTEDCVNKNLPFHHIDINDYILHLGSGSYRGKAWRQWLEENKELYTMEDKKTKNKKIANDNCYLVVIPYFAGGAQGREIEYAVAGWRRHFKEDFLIVVVGDYHPVVDTGDDIMYIPCERVPEPKPGNYRTHIDFVKKFRTVHKAFPNSKGFVFVADDVYAVNDFDIWDVRVLKQNTKEIVFPMIPTKPWYIEKRKTKEFLQKNGYPVRNFVTHLPIWFDWDKLEEMFDKYDMDNNSYIVEDLYFNIYYPTRIPAPLHIDHDNFKCGVYRPNPRIEYIRRAFKEKIWIQNSVEGWIPQLEKMLQEYYNL